MPSAQRQIPSLVLPQEWVIGDEVEVIGDLVAHASIDCSTMMSMQEKQFHILATEAVGFGTPGNLWVWVEVSPYPSSVTTAYWEAIGGSVGAVTPVPDVPRVPVAPNVIVATGTNLTQHRLILPFTLHDEYCRICVRTPVSADLATAQWAVQALFMAKY